MKNKQIKSKIYLFTVFTVILIIISLLAPYLAPNDPMETNSNLIRIAPTWTHPLGTDSLGRCVLSRVLYGARISIFSALTLVIVSFIFGVAVGVVSGYYGGKLDNIIMRIIDSLLAFPEMVLAIAVAGILGGSLINAMIATGVTSWIGYARLARSYTMTLKNEAFVNAARINCFTDFQILKKHIVPNIIGALVVNASMQIGIMMISIAGLSFLGLGVTPPATEWGSMLSEARTYIQLAPWASLSPAIAIFISVFVFNGLGEAVRDYYNE